MTDHATEAERFHNEYLRIRTPGQLPTTGAVLALANYHATMAAVDAIRELAPNTAQDAAGDDLRASQPEPGQVDAPGATRCPARRWKACVDAWPDCESGEYNPACCRFPKSCSATLLDDEEASSELVVTDEPGEVDGGEATEATGGGWSRNRVAYWEPPAEPLATYALPSKWALGASEPVPLGGGEATGAGEFADCPRCDRHLRAVQHFKSRAEKAEAERDAVLHSVRAARASLDPLAHRNPRDEYEQGVRNVARRTLDELDRILDRHTPEG